tara:strand:- start:333 stop:1289 length:957 start_codon:yes stop_codon:yes gene_type:complete
MVHRKLIKFGNSSYVVSIPKAWIEKNKLKKGDEIYCDDGGHELLLHPRPRQENFKEQEMVVDIEGKSINRVYNEIFSAYINNYNSIKIIGKNLASKLKYLREFLHNFVALEIIEQTSNKVIAKDFLNVQDISVKDMVRRMDITIRSMFVDLLECNSKNKENLADKIYERDKDVNRLYFLLMRVIKNAMNNPNIANSINLHGTELLGKWLEIFYLEDIADEIKRIARFLKEVNLNKKEESVLYELNTDLQKLYLDVRKASYVDDKNLAHEISCTYRPKLVDRCNEFFRKGHTPDVGRMLERMKKMVSGIKNLAVIIHDN